MLTTRTCGSTPKAGNVMHQNGSIEKDWSCLQQPINCQYCHCAVLLGLHCKRPSQLLDLRDSPYSDMPDILITTIGIQKLLKSWTCANDWTGTSHGISLQALPPLWHHSSQRVFKKKMEIESPQPSVIQSLTVDDLVHVLHEVGHTDTILLGFLMVVDKMLHQRFGSHCQGGSD